jgi:uncharacterized membrane protein
VLATANLSGDITPLPSFPLLNPVDLTQLGALVAMVHWVRSYRRVQSLSVVANAQLSFLVPGLLFLWFNGMLARTIHSMGGGDFSWIGLWNNVTFQVAISVSWALIGMALTVWASRIGRRPFWLTGAVLLGVVVLKLAVVDMGTLSTGARIGTFLVVGVLLLAVGYFAPVPPAKTTSDPIDSATEEAQE